MLYQLSYTSICHLRGDERNADLRLTLTPAKEVKAKQGLRRLLRLHGVALGCVPEGTMGPFSDESEREVPQVRSEASPPNPQQKKHALLLRGAVG